MREHSKHASSIVIAVTALCFVWLLSSHIILVPAFAEGVGQPLPIESLPADTTITATSVVLPDSGVATTNMIEVVILFLSAVL
jgi:hypothetical protein